MRQISRSAIFSSSALLALIMFFWWLGARLHLAPESFFPSPMSVLRALRGELTTGRLFADIVASLFRVLTGFTLGAVVGILCGLGLGSIAWLRVTLFPLINFLRNISTVSWIPFAVLWLGIGDLPVIFLIFVGVVFPILVSTTFAVHSVPAVYHRIAQDYHIVGAERLLKVVLPAIAPQVTSAIRVTAGLAWTVAVAAEMIAGRDGLGFAIWDARNGLRSDILMLEMGVIGLLGLTIDYGLKRLAQFASVRGGEPSHVE